MSAPDVPMAVHEEPAARLDSYGSGALSDGELVALVIGGGNAQSADRGRELVAQAGSLSELAKWPVARLVEAGMSAAVARRLAAVGEIGRRSLVRPERPMLDHSEGVANYMLPATSGLDVEKFWVLCLDRRGRLLKRVEVTSGTATATLVHPREVFRAAIQEGASGIICVHNHPSGDPSPSAQDIRITRTLREAAAAVDINLIDHVVMGMKGVDPLGAGFYSFRAAGVL